MPLSFVGSLLELLGVAAVLPFLFAVTKPKLWQTNPYMLKTYDYLGFAEPRSFVLFLGTVILAAMVLREIFTIWLGWYRTRFVSELERQLSEQLLETYLTRSYRFFLTRHSSDLGQNVLVRVNRFMSGFFNPILSLAKAAITFVVFLAGFVWLNPGVAAVTLSTFGSAHLLIYRRLKPWLIDVSRELRDLNTSRFRTANEALQGIREAKLLGCEKFYLTTYARQNSESINLKLKRVLVTQLPRLVSRSSLLLLAVSAVLYLLITQQEQQLVPLMVVYLLLVLRLVPQIQGLFGGLAGLKSEQAVLEELCGDLMLGVKEPEVLGAEVVPFRREFELKNVDFRYNEDRPPALVGINLRIECGTRVAIVGQTGAGKTTLLDVLTGLLPLDHGQLVVDGKVQPPNAAGWRLNVGYVPQDNYLVDDTIAQNIAFGVAKDEIDLDAVKRAAQIADLHDFIDGELPDKYNTTVGDRGSSVSRGQMQRIGIARAMYRDPNFLVLDEATSNLDPATERRVLDNISALKPTRTVVIVTHRMKTATECAQIAVIHQGRVVGFGSESSLRENCPEFLELNTVARYSAPQVDEIN